MQNESFKYASRNPFRLLTSIKESKEKIEISLVDSKVKEQLKVNPPAKKIADRYTSEIASVSKMKEYDNVALKQREALLQENKVLREKFSEDVQEARKIERNVAVISQTIGEFLQILQSQSETVSDMHQAGKEATDQLKKVDENLDLTIKRTESHSNMMISIIGIMTVLILLLDYFTP
jgi:DNA repair ATPase RecN